MSFPSLHPFLSAACASKRILFFAVTADVLVVVVVAVPPIFKIMTIHALSAFLMPTNFRIVSATGVADSERGSVGLILGSVFVTLFPPLSTSTQILRTCWRASMRQPLQQLVWARGKHNGHAKSQALLPLTSLLLPLYNFDVLPYPYRFFSFFCVFLLYFTSYNISFPSRQTSPT